MDGYFAAHFAPQDDALAAALAANAAAGLPPHDVSPLQGRLLQVLATAVHARSVLEVGTLGGYSTIWLARALPPGGRVVTLEANPAHAAVAVANLERAGVAKSVELVVGRAAETLPRLAAEGRGPFDLIFIDADKPSNPEYLGWALRLSRPGTLIVGDNVVRGGAVADATSADPNVLGVRRFTELLAAEPRLLASAVQTVGCKGYDGFAIAVVRPAPDAEPGAAELGRSMDHRSPDEHRRSDS
ncbi:MAG: O-methyltransferase [Phycisphaerales bacterium]